LARTVIERLKLCSAEGMRYVYIRSIHAVTNAEIVAGAALRWIAATVIATVHAQRIAAR
jgi:hypothetical protein